MREKGASALGYLLSELDNESMKSLLRRTIDEHIERVSKEEDAKDELSSISDVELKDELDDEGNPIDTSVPEEPKKRKRPTGNPEKSKAKKKTEDQMTKLKSYVFKCGVRRIWKKELDGLSGKESIAKLHKILEELGVEGRPTLEKCKKVKERREYKEEMKIIDKDKILDNRLRGERKQSENPVKAEVVVRSLDLSAYGDSE